MPSITLNGEAMAVDPGHTVADLLVTLELEPTQVAVERNRDIVPRAQYGQTELSDGDVLEVVTFVGGG